MVNEVLIQEVRCKRCLYKWIPRKNIIYVCPRCHSPKWNEEEGIIKINKEMEPKDILKIIIGNPIFAEDLRIIGGLVRG